MAASFNMTDLEGDPFHDDYEDEYVRGASLMRVLDVSSMITDLIKFLLCLCVIAADIFLITIICKTKKLKTKTNSFIVNYAIFNMISIVAIPLFEILRAITRFNFGRFYCIVEQIESSSILFCHMFGFGLAFEWFFVVFYSSPGKFFSNIHKYSVYLIYVIGTIQFLSTVPFCLTDDWIVRHMIDRVTFVGICGFLGVCNYFSYKRTSGMDDNKYALTAANIMVFFWLPLFLYDELFIHNGSSMTLYFILEITLFIPDWLAYGSPIIVIISLGKSNKYFQMAYSRAFKRSVRKYASDEDGLDESEDNTIGENGTNVYDNATPI
nr:uncharacterized protein LOC111514166 isoform X2 [Leptinotarsa decemlineata]